MVELSLKENLLVGISVHHVVRKEPVCRLAEIVHRGYSELVFVQKFLAARKISKVRNVLPKK